ncbi:MAG: hypothetical protein OM95_12670 [Bdellovibrio sp. ArHS]|uniref:hypothetical protein n=1 Tax=Bdellovibrio sp. ArHS TaxID=1569284 RepID=UPI0005832729|nr:hypothetical protein [Bdellovibrio sp. ArHS]KHD87850.1 MAG: hypothetical protein OM95_12670 [Bdellovibrio sp. ArHS]
MQGSENQHLTLEDFDALVTGHLVHYSIWYDSIFSDIVLNYLFPNSPERKDLFEGFFFKGTIFSIEKKINFTKELTKLIPQLKSEPARWNSLFKEIEDIRIIRNTMTHGLLQESLLSPLKLIVSKKNANQNDCLEVTQEYFNKLLDRCETTLKELQRLLHIIKNS